MTDSPTARQDRKARRPILVRLFALIALTMASTNGLADSVNIQKIAVSLPSSPYLGQTVTTSGIVIAVLSDGFYIENNSSWDSNTCSSEGIYVYTPSITPSSSTIAIAQSVTVTGLVQASNASKYAGVQIYISSPNIGSSGNIVINSSGNTLPTVVSSSTLTAATSGTCSSYGVNSFGQWLPFEGMRVNIPSSSTLLVAQGTGGTVDASAQTATTNGQFWGVLSTTRPTRTEGINTLDPAYASAPSGLTTWSGNPQLLLVDSTVLGGTALDASAGTIYTGSSELVGIVDYHVSSQGYTGLLLYPNSVSALSKQGGASPVAASSRLSTDQILIATLDLNSLVSTETNRIAKLSNAIINYMHSPDLIAVQGAESAALSLLTSQISTDGGPSYTVSTVSTADSSGLVNAFLILPSHFNRTPSATQQLTTSTYTDSGGTSHALFDRSPLLLQAAIARAGISDFTLYVLNTTLASRNNLASATLSENARIQRDQQAVGLTTQLLEPLETASKHVVVLGGLNSFEFSDGYVDTTGILDGNEAASGTVWLYDSSYNTSTLINSTVTATNATAKTTNASANRYTVVESGTAVQTDHLLVTSELSSLFLIDYARIGADFPVSKSYDTSSVARASHHDGLIGYFSIPFKTQTVAVTSGSPSYYDTEVTFTATVNVVDEETGLVNSSYTPDGTVTFLDTDGTKLGYATLSGGVATFQYSKLTVGTHTITASYGGSESYLGYQASSGTVQQIVEKDITALTVSGSPNPSYYGQPVTFTAVASSIGETPTGTVSFYDTGGTKLGSATLSSGSATLSTSVLTVGTHTITASYEGDTTNTAQTATYSQTVQSNVSTATVVSSVNPVYYGEPVTFSATLTASYETPTGSVTFLIDGSTAATTTLSSGVASMTTSSLSVGTHTVQVSYTGDGTHDGASSNPLTQTVLPVYSTTSTLSCTPLIAKVGTTIACSDTLTSSNGAPSGTITYYDGSTQLGTATVTSGSATFSLSSLTPGAHTITATYAKKLPYLASTSNAVTLTILSDFTLSATPTSQSLYTGEAATYTLTVKPGTQFTLDVALACSGLPDNASCTFTPSTVTGGSGTSTLVVQTSAPARVSALTPFSWTGKATPLLALLVLPWVARRRRAWPILLLLMAVVSSAISACGGAGTLSSGTAAGTYTVTVTGTASYSGVEVTASTPVTLQVKSLF